MFNLLQLFILQIGYTFLLPCVLAGLSAAPHYVTAENRCCNDGCLIAGDVDSVVVPADDACGGDGALAFARPKNNKMKPNPRSQLLKRNIL
ncbi:hypothetical protein GW17_00027115 [Ensete ventricosum]|nr:hypothetical protein GW17_00027115 [Ensete ventricosum]